MLYDQQPPLKKQQKTIQRDWPVGLGKQRQISFNKICGKRPVGNTVIGKMICCADFTKLMTELHHSLALYTSSDYNNRCSSSLSQSLHMTEFYIAKRGTEMRCGISETRFILHFLRSVCAASTGIS